MFQADDWPLPEHGRPKNTYLQNFMAPEELVLKVGAQVMLIKIRSHLSDPLVGLEAH